MRYAFLIIIGLHALIHLLGFVKGFQVFDLKDFPLQISKSTGLIWLGAFFILAVTIVFYLIRHPFWWLFGFAGLILSQILIIGQWTDAKFGSIPNIILFLIVIIAFSKFEFERKADGEIKSILNASKPVKPIEEKNLDGLPKAVQRWLKFSGVIGKPGIENLYMEQSYKIKLKPEQENWYHAKASQTSTSDPPAFVWTVDMQMMPLVFTYGRDRFIQGEGEMLIKLLSFLPVAKDGPNPKINESALQRYIGELVWYPSACTLDQFKWREIDENTAEATMSYLQTEGSGIFEFDEEGKLIRFTAMRYMGSGEDAVKMEWFVQVLAHREFDGIILPSQCTATWRLESGDWTWAEFEVDKVIFNFHQ
ncbi:DUF6544 family protein [Cecembia rubra]|uniref:Uncharacterized protein n=1 Tax=Cecembia rubra TaxID=1485585 RepID=A0A2P8ECQ0_9BACT|nr:DUF6544 family protein [Cecembia rubra]PSL07248.1 hypothetical protein CLV48_101178 [Cecembia rubra]